MPSLKGILYASERQSIILPADISLQDEHPLVYDSWKDQAKINMFLVTSKEDIQTEYIEGIKISNQPYYKCIEVRQGKMTLRLEGKGDHVELSEWQ